MPVSFGENMRSGCSFHVTRDELTHNCQFYRQRILQLLLGRLSLPICIFIFSNYFYKCDNHHQISIGGLKIVDNQLENTDNLLELLQNTRIATFGDSDHLKPGDWIQIILSKPPLDTFNNDGQAGAATSPGICRDMLLNLHIEIAFAKIGSFANPQAKIIGVNYKFGSSQDVTYQCIGFGACKNPSKTQRIEKSL